MDTKTDWPREGASLVEAIERFAGPELLAECRAARSATPYWAFERDRVFPVWWTDKSGKSQSAEAAVILATRARELTRACLTPVIEAWDTGRVRVIGRRRDMLAAAVEIPAPVNLWTVSVVDLERSIIDDPGGGKIFDLRFVVVEAQPVGRAKASFRWLESAVENLKRSPDTPPKMKQADVARLLHSRMAKAVRRGDVKNALGEDTIANYLRDYGLWP
jgi:hypothetical protein